MKKTSVGLVVLTDVPSMGGLVAVLQVRGEFNHEKMGPESYPRACQITVAGKCKEGEALLNGLLREAKEELGEKIAKLVEYRWHAGAILELGRVETDEKLVVNFGVRVPCMDLFGCEDTGLPSSVQLHPSTGGVRLITSDKVESIMNIKQFDKNDGVNDSSVTAMFPDEKEAVRLAFEKLGSEALAS